MLEVVDNRIYLTRGDSAYITISVSNADGTAYEPVAGDKLYFRLKKNIFGSTLLLVRAISLETFTLELSPTDTAILDFGSYRYEIELITASGDRFTVIENGELVLGVELETHDV